MAKKRKGELPSGSIRRKVYSHSELKFDEKGNPVLDPKTGKQKKKKIYISVTAETPIEANKLASEIKYQRSAIAAASSNMTLYEAIDRYISSSSSLLSPSTIRGYKTIQRSAFRCLMSVKLADITDSTMRDAINAECQRTTGKKNPKPISSKTVINEYGLIIAVINTYLPGTHYNVKLPQIEHNKHDISSPDVIYEIVKDSDIELPVMLAMWLSFTESEILGLTKSKSISSDGQYITVKEVIVKDADGNAVIKNKGKQPSRDRTLRIPEYIKTLIDQVETDQLVTISGTALSKRFNRLIKKAGIPHMTFHDLRHVNASVMALLNIPDKYAQDRGGWKSDNIMKSVYMQTFSQQREEVDNRIDDYMCDLIFKDSAKLKMEKKYQCWLELFDKKDTTTNKKCFEKFCRDNNIV